VLINVTVLYSVLLLSLTFELLSYQSKGYYYYYYYYVLSTTFWC